VDITYFNLSEIRKKARQDQAAILILTFAQTKLYNAYTTTGLMKSLKINHVPPFLIINGTLEQRRVLKCTYKTREPMSYFRNPWFLTQNVSTKDKIDYLQLLSMRRISEDVDYIPQDYVAAQITNPFIEYKEDKIYFTQESSVSRKSYT
jgi:hypothetical protein